MKSVIDVSGRHGEHDRETIGLFRNCMRIAVELTDPGEPAPPLGTDRLREALAHILGGRPDLIAVTAGVRASVPVLAPLMQDVAFETPSFEDLPQLAQSLGCNARRVSWPQLQLDDAQPVWMTHPARNPDGASLADDLVERLGRRQHIAVINEIYRWHAKSPAVVPVNNIIAVGSLAKIWGPAARIGWIRGEMVTELNKAALRISSPPAVIQDAWASFLGRGGLAYLVDQAQAASASRERFAELVDQARLAPVNDGPSVVVRLPRQLPTDEAISRLAALGVKATAGHHFGLTFESLRFDFTNVPIPDAEHVAELYTSLFSEPSIV